MTHDTLQRQMRTAFFDVCDDGVLIYQDQAIGRYENTVHQVTLRLNVDQETLELHIQDAKSESFSLTGRVAEACMEASGAYFSAVADLSRRARLRDTAQGADPGRLRLVS